MSSLEGLIGHNEVCPMGLRTRLKTRLRHLLNRFSGEYSAAAETVVQREEWEGNMAADDEVKVTMPRTRRPKEKGVDRP